MKQSRLPEAWMVAGAQRLWAAASRSSLVRSVRRRGDERKNGEGRRRVKRKAFFLGSAAVFIGPGE